MSRTPGWVCPPLEDAVPCPRCAEPVCLYRQKADRDGHRCGYCGLLTTAGDLRGRMRWFENAAKALGYAPAQASPTPVMPDPDGPTCGFCGGDARRCGH